MWAQLTRACLRLEEIETQLSQPETYDDPDLAASLNKEQKDLLPLVEAYRQHQKAQSDLDGLADLLDDPECRQLAKAEETALRAELDRLEEELRLLLQPKDPMDGKDVFLEIRAGVGGEEAALFAADLFRMYSMYGEKQGWRLELTNVNQTELGGVKELSCLVKGETAYARLKHESGVHRVQRVPETESGGRIHTSTCTVAVLPQVDEVLVVCRPADVDAMSALLPQEKVSFVFGGKTRQESVQNAVDTIDDCDLLLIHDGARPLVTRDEILDTLHRAAETGAAATGVFVKDTIKVINDDYEITDTPDRSQLIAIQTPQIFRFDLYKQAMEKAKAQGGDFTDDCKLMENLGVPVSVVIGEYTNMKITTPEDLPMAEAILKAREAE